MKKTLLFSVALAGLMLGSCSSSDDLNGGGTGNPGFNKDGNGFMSISVNLPTRSGSTTRAENDKYEDGLSSEYEVKNGILALFDASGKTSEGEYTLLAAYKLDLTDSELDTDGDNITSTHSVVTQIKSTTATDVYALVLLNDNSILTASDGKLLQAGTTDLTGKTYNEILAQTTENAMTGTGFFMANAPVSATPGNTAAPDGKYTTLSKVDLSKIKETRNEAINDPAVSVFVERGVAKVSLNSTASGTTDDDNLPYEFNGWVLDNTTKSSYIVRNMGTDAGNYLKYSSEKFAPALNSRFVGDTKLGATSKQPEDNLYRTYWCVDPTYDKTFTEATHKDYFNTVTSAADVTSWLTSGKYVYCHENTFDVDRMNYSNTTRALVKVTFNGGNKFYTNNGANAILDTDDKRDDAVMSYVLGTDINIVDLKKYLSDNQGSTGTVTWEKKDFKLTWAPAPDKDGILKVKAIELSTDGQAKLKAHPSPFTGWDAIKDQLNTNRVIRQYDNGASYYEVRIKHFAGDDTGAGDLAPWNTGWESVKPSASVAYPGNKEQNYLGRYGLVRNNWYDIDVTAIKKIGSPVVPDITTDNTPDDNIDAYISAKINVLSWAKRTQSTVLGK
ncbi:fimbria major subunit [Segatella copri]|uniref:fimbria major subunit n=1 Tax=Segatella copri TaxID=165179 RepID=UPI00294B4E49|nr:fimbria major subunit [Segatella copri]WOG03885.1 fimbria major subunit [Segatella copri]